jgi:ribosomal protein S18 acetylase RimI-like enzyme
MITIKRLQLKDDLGDLVALSRAFFGEYEAHHRAFFRIDELRDNDVIDFFSRTLGSDDGATFVATVNGSIVGYVTVFVRAQPGFYKVKTVGAISGLMVHQDHRRRGIASSLLAEAMGWFREKGVEYVTVYTAVANRAAVKFYERNGMAPLHVTLIGETGTGHTGI